MTTPQPVSGFRLSPQQARIWSSQSGGRIPVCQISFSLAGPLDPAGLQAALASVVRRHEILRTTFRGRAGMTLPLQVINAVLEPDWRIIDLTDASAPDLAARLAALDGEDRRRAFDFENGPLL